MARNNKSKIVTVLPLAKVNQKFLAFRGTVTEAVRWYKRQLARLFRTHPGMFLGYSALTGRPIASYPISPNDALPALRILAKTADVYGVGRWEPPTRSLKTGQLTKAAYQGLISDVRSDGHLLARGFWQITAAGFRALAGEAPPNTVYAFDGKLVGPGRKVGRPRRR